MTDRLAAAWRRLSRRQQTLLAGAVVALAVVLFVVRARRSKAAPVMPAGPADDTDTAVIPSQPAGGTRTVGGGGGGGGGVDIGGATSTGSTSSTSSGTSTGSTITTSPGVTVTAVPATMMVARLPTAGTRPGQSVASLPAPGTAVTESVDGTIDPYGGPGYYGTGSLGFSPSEIARGGNVIVQVGTPAVTEQAGIPIPATIAANQPGAPVVNAALPDLSAWRGQTATAQSIAILRAATPEQLASSEWRSTFNAIVQAEGGTLRV